MQVPLIRVAIRSTRLVLVLVLVAVHGAAAQSDSAQMYRVKQCDPPATPIGYIHGLAQVSYLIDDKGRPDTASLRAVGSDSISLPGVRSAAVRQLAACTFEVPKGTAARQSVLQALRFDGLNILLSPLMVTPGLEPAVNVPSARVPTVPLEVTDSLLEERPYQVGCDRRPGLSLTSSRPQLMAAANRTAAAWERENSGTVTARVIVGVDGRIEPGSLVILSSPNASVTNMLRPVIASCRYAPGRIGGVPVRTTMTVAQGARP